MLMLVRKSRYRFSSSNVSNKCCETSIIFLSPVKYDGLMTSESSLVSREN